MAETPLFSVLMSSYNMAAYLADAVESVRRQSFAAVELLIVDDGSTDGGGAVLDSIEALGDPRIRVWRQANAGKSAALNLMLAEARGAWVALQDADDLSHPDRFARAAARLAQAAPPAALMSGHSLLVDGRVMAPRAQAKSVEACRADIAAFRMPAHDPTVIVRRDIARSLGFEESLRVAMGLDFILRLGEAHPIEVIGAPLYDYRVTPGSLTRSNLGRRAEGVRRVMDRARLRRGMPPFDDAGFAAYYGRLASDPTNNLIGHFTDSAYLQRAAGDQAGALATAVAAFRIAPFGPASFKPLVYALAPMPLARRIRARRAA